MRKLLALALFSTAFYSSLSPGQNKADLGLWEARVFSPAVATAPAKYDEKIQPEDKRFDKKGILGSNRQVETQKTEYQSGASAVAISGGNLVLENPKATIFSPEASVRDRKRVVVRIPEKIVKKTIEKEIFGRRVVVEVPEKIEARDEENEIVTDITKRRNFGVSIAGKKPGGLALPLPQEMEFSLTTDGKMPKVKLLKANLIEAALIDSAIAAVDKQFSDNFDLTVVNEKEFTDTVDLKEDYKKTAMANLRASILKRITAPEVADSLTAIIAKVAPVASQKEEIILVASKQPYGWKIRVKGNAVSVPAGLEKDIVGAPNTATLLIDANGGSSLLQGFWTRARNEKKDNFPGDGFEWSADNKSLLYGPRLGNESKLVAKFLSQFSDNIVNDKNYVIAMSVQEDALKFVPGESLALAVTLQVYEHDFKAVPQTLVMSVRYTVSEKGAWSFAGAQCNQKVDKISIPTFLGLIVNASLNRGFLNEGRSESLLKGKAITQSSLLKTRHLKDANAEIMALNFDLK